MAFEIRLLQGFEADLTEAIDWYMAINTKNAEDLVNDLEQTILTLSKNPFLFQQLKGKVRKTNLAVYPYKVIFEVRQTELVIIALAHHKRSPKYWKKRPRV